MIETWINIGVLVANVVLLTRAARAQRRRDVADDEASFFILKQQRDSLLDLADKADETAGRLLTQRFPSPEGAKVYSDLAQDFRKRAEVANNRMAKAPAAGKRNVVPFPRKQANDEPS